MSCDTSFSFILCCYIVETTEETDGKFVEVIAPQQTDEEQVQPIPVRFF
jgi:hypothetical protein